MKSLDFGLGYDVAILLLPSFTRLTQNLGLSDQ
jgi:hypothetical protein